MKTVRCPVCRRMYEFAGLPPEYCPECYIREEELYQKVRKLVKERPGITVMEASAKTGVPQLKILRYVREERLEAIPSGTVFLHCVSCGKMINTGIYCADCKRRYGDNDPAAVANEKQALLDKKTYNVENKVDDRIKKL